MATEPGSPLIDVTAARSAIAAGAVAIDCRHDLADPTAGERAWTSGHVPGARHAHLDRDLSDLSRRGEGRHPLPSAAAFAATLARWGIDAGTPVIAYDAGNAAFAARLWWMLRAVGHHRATVLDGGYAAWTAAGLPVATAVPDLAPAAPRALSWDAAQLVDHAGAWDAARNPETRLIDARASARYRGDEEPIDPIAGHVPGAVNRPFADNLGSDGRFKPPAQLRDEFLRLLDGRAPSALVAMCGSGVTACHHLLALAQAGLPGARLYAPSWSGWISDPARPVARGEN
jgi:thiosulfate/3-mercaptopyruvate sulfurtransferase